MSDISSDDEMPEYIESCVSYAEDVLSFQMPAVDEKKFDFGPHIQKMNTELFLVGVMWRYSEQFEYPTEPRDRAFLCFMYYLIRNGAKEKEAKKRMQELVVLSRDKEGKDTLAISIGHEVGEKEGALAAVLEEFRDIPAVSGSTQRMLDAFKISAIVFSISAFVISLIIGRSLLEAIGIGAVIGIAIIIIGSQIYYKLVGK